MEDPLLNSTLCQFRILEKRGQGGMGCVYKALDTELQRIVALKLLSPPLVQDEKALQLFRTEAIAASKINHPNICTIYEIGAAENQHYIAMEFVDGPTLGDLLRQHGHLSEWDVLWIAEQVCAALSAAHAAGILHQDIKPDNILLGKNPALVKLTDFGVARLASEAAKIVAADTTRRPIAEDEQDSRFVPDLVTATYSGLMGTATYMSPEQVRREPVDQRSDIFSLGITLLELLTGKKLFAATSQISELERIATTDATALLKDATLPARWRPLIRKCIESKPCDRYPSAADLLRDVRALKSRSKRGADSFIQMEGVVRRRRRLAWLFAFTPGLLFLVFFLYSIKAPHTPPPEPLPAISGDVTVTSPVAYSYFLVGRNAWWRYAAQTAINNLQMAVDSDTSFAYAYALLGVLLRWNGRPEEGRICLQKAKRHQKKLSEPERLLVDGYSYYMLDKNEEMLASFTQLTRAFPDFIDGHLGHALAFEQFRDFAGAIRATRSVLKIDSTHIAALANLADMYIWQAQFDSALYYANLRLQTLRDSPDITGLGVAYEQVGAVQHYLGYLGEAIANLEIAVDEDPQNKDAIIALAEAYLLDGQLQRAQSLLKNHLLLALRPAERAVMYEYLAHLYVFTGRYMHALEHLDIANSLYRDADFAHGVAWTRLNRSLLFRELGRLDQEKREIDEVRLYAQSHSKALSETTFFILNEFMVALENKDFERAMAILHDGLRVVSPSDRLFLESKYELALGDTVAAIDKLVLLLQHDDRPILGLLIEPKYDLAKLLLRTGEYDRAADYCNRALYTKRVLMFAQTPIFYSKSMVLLTEILEKQGQTEKAIAACERFLHYWQEADAGMPLLAEVRERLARLQPYIGKAAVVAKSMHN